MQQYRSVVEGVARATDSLSTIQDISHRLLSYGNTININKYLHFIF
jgi:hypothetical protein